MTPTVPEHVVRKLKPEVVPLDAVSCARNLVGWAFILATCILLGPPYVVLMAVLYPFGLAPRWGDFTVSWWLRVLRWLWRVEFVVEGLEHIEPGQTYVIVSNHRSHLDAVACVRGLRPKLRFGFIMKRSLALIPIWGWFIWLAGYLPVDRGGGGRRNQDQLATAVKYLQRGRSVLIFPEGTRAPDHRFRPFKKGAAVLAVRAGVPVLPVVVSGTGRLWPRDSLFIRPGRVRLEICPPIPTADRSLDERDAVLREVQQAIVSRYRLEVDEPAVGEQPALLTAVSSR